MAITISLYVWKASMRILGKVIFKEHMRDCLIMIIGKAKRI